MTAATSTPTAPAPAQSTGWLSPWQAGLRLNLSSDRVRQLANSGVLECVRTPLGRLVSEDSVQRLLAHRQELTLARLAAQRD